MRIVFLKMSNIKSVVEITPFSQMQNSFKQNTKSFHNNRNLIVSYWFISLHFLMSFTAYSQISFSEQKLYQAGISPEVVRIGDLNDDGLNDVVVGTTFYFDTATDYKIFVFIQDHSGNLHAPEIYSYPKLHSGLSSILIGDLNNDDLNDVAIAYRDTVGIFYQNYAGKLDPMKSYYSGAISNLVDGISSGDLNNDGLTDIAVSHGGGNVISVLIQKPTGGFTIQNYPSPSTTYNQIEVGDLNNDQKDDVVLMSGGGYNRGIHVYFQNTVGTLDNFVTYMYPNCALEGITIGDINNDHINDIIEVLYSGNPTDQLSLRPQNPINHQYDSVIQINAYYGSDVVRAEDLNCDGINEIIIAHGGWSSFSVYEHAEDGNYTTYKRFPFYCNTHINHNGLSVGDINNDGKKDIVTVNDYNGLVVLLNQSSNSEFVEKPIMPSGAKQVCLSGQLSVYHNNPTNADSIHWNLYPPRAGTIIYSDKDSCQILWKDSWTGECSLWITAVNSCGKMNSDTLIINSDRLPSLNLGNDTILCAGNSLKLNVGSGFKSIRWQNNSHDSIFIATRGGIYSVTAGNDCGIRNDTILITNIPLPEINLKDTAFCKGDDLQINLFNPAIKRYLWNDGINDPFRTVSSPGLYRIEITDTNNCSNFQAFSVDELSAPSLNWPSDTTVCSHNPLTLNAESPGCRYLWMNGSTDSHFNVSESGEYSVSVSNQCSNLQRSITVKIEDCMSYLNVPSAFSPNRDGLNDVLYPVGNNVQRIHFLIFNRWGQVVYESNSLDEGWNGTYMGKDLNPGVFVYIITALSIIEGEPVQKKGNITLIR